MVFLLLGISLGAVILIGAALWALHNYGDFFAYNGLSRQRVLTTKKQLEKHYDLLSSVKGKTLFGDTFHRGVYIPKQGGIPLYYRLEYKRDGGVSFDLYPMLLEKWSTNPNLLGTKAV